MFVVACTDECTFALNFGIPDVWDNPGCKHILYIMNPIKVPKNVYKSRYRFIVIKITY